MAMMVKILLALSILPYSPPGYLQGGWWRLHPLHLCGCMGVWAWAALHGVPWLTSMHICLLCGYLGMGARTVLWVLVCVTLNLSLPISVSHSPSLDLCPGLLSLVGSVKVQVCLCIGTATLPWTALTSLHLPITWWKQAFLGPCHPVLLPPGWSKSLVSPYLSLLFLVHHSFPRNSLKSVLSLRTFSESRPPAAWSPGCQVLSGIRRTWRPGTVMCCENCA